MRWPLALVALVGCGRIGFDEMCGIEGPCVEARINDGATYARGPRLTLKVTTSTDDAGQEVFMSEPPCELPADAAWRPHADDAPVAFLVEPTDGPKQVCVWVRDATGVGFASATIKYETLNLPQIDKLDVVALDATRARANWTASDVEGLATQPINLEIRTGATWNPLASGLGDASGMGSYDFDMPAVPFIVRAIPIDRAGNRGVPGTSDVIGSAGWSVYAGSLLDDLLASSGRGLRLEFAANTAYMFAIDPATMDAFVVAEDRGIIRVDGATGDASLLIGVGTDNLPSDGPLPANATLPTNAALHMGPDGALYVASGNTSNNLSSIIYQIDLATLRARRYLGGGLANDQTATPSTVWVAKHIWTFDEDGTLYFVTSCTPGTASSPMRMRVMKAARNPDGTAGAIQIVAGDCTSNAPPTTGPRDPLTVALPVYRQFQSIGTIAAFERGKNIYLGSFANLVWKIVDGQLWPSNMPMSTEGTLGYDPSTQKVLVGTGPLHAFTPGATASDPPSGERMHDDGGAGCSEDGVDAASACVHVTFGIQGTATRAYVADGAAINAHRAYRVRFVDKAGRMQTYIGGHGFYGEGMDRRSVRSRIAGIAYKPATAMNQAAFPAGLYFTDPLDVVLGYIDPTTNRASIVWGNRSGTSHVYTPGESIGPDKSLGFAYGAGNVKALAIGADGLPMLRYGADERYSALISVNASRQAIPSTNGMNDWEIMADGTNPATADLWPYGTTSNLTYYAGSLFLLGGYDSYNPTATLKRLDFTGSQVKRLMGAGADAVSPDTATPLNASFSSNCHNESLQCFTRYRVTDDRLYFSEDNSVRYLTTPFGASQTLATLFTAPVQVGNFIFRPDGSQVYYGRNALRCHDISSGSPACNDSVLGPPTVLGPTTTVADQMTWIDNNTLLLSTNQGQVLQYTVQ